MKARDGATAGTVRPAAGERAQPNDAEIKWADLIRKSETDSARQAREINAIRTLGPAARKSEAEIERQLPTIAKEREEGSNSAQPAMPKRQRRARCRSASASVQITSRRLVVFERARINETLSVGGVQLPGDSWIRSPPVIVERDRKGARRSKRRLGGRKNG